MSESQAPVQDQPQETPDSPEVVETPETPVSDKFDPANLPSELLPAYKQLQGDYTRKTQQLAEERKQASEALEVYQGLRDPDKAHEVLQRFGYEVGDDEDDTDEEYTDPVDELRAELESLKADRQQELTVRQQQQMQEAEFSHIDSEIQALETSTGRELSDEEAELVGTLALAQRTDDGHPDVKGAYERLYTDFLAKQREGWVSSKKSPRVPSGGAPGSKGPDMDNERERQEWMAQRLGELDDG